MVQRTLSSFQPSSLGHQVLCITHLPQLAAYGDVHFHVAKLVVPGGDAERDERTITEVHVLSGDDRIAELAHA